MSLTPSDGQDLDDTTSRHLRDALAGNVDSLGAVVARLAPLLEAHAAWRLGSVLRSHYDPEDLVADAWACLLPRLTDLRARSGRHTPVLVQFLATSIRNRINNLLKKHIRARRAQDQRRDPDDSGSLLERLPASVTGAVTAARRNEEVLAVRTALEELDPVDREVIFLRAIEQHSNANVALVLGITPEATAMRYSRALKRLRARLPGSVFEDLASS